MDCREGKKSASRKRKKLDEEEERKGREGRETKKERNNSERERKGREVKGCGD